MATVKEGLYYTKTHQWAKIDGNVVTIGITDFAQEQLGEISMVDLNYSKIVGTTVQQLEMSGNEASSSPISDVSVESAKAVGEIFPPVTGKVVAVNNKLDNEPELINKDPYGEGWLFKIEASNLSKELRNLLNAKAYKLITEGA